MASRLIAIEAENLIIEQEVSSVVIYRKKYSGVIWPGADSGATIAIGIDLGYTTVDQFRKDWTGRIPAEWLAQLERAVGVKGEAARRLVASGVFRGIAIPWEVALAHFEEVEIPRWLKKLAATFPNTELMNPLMLGALLSLIFNRGTALTDKKSDRRKEMMNIYLHCKAERFDRIPGEIRAMKRLWAGKNLDGLLKRRDAEADMFAKGLASLAA